MTIRPLRIVALEGEFAICRLPHDAPIPEWATAASLFAVTRTSDELSIVCNQANVPLEFRCERNWRCLRVAGSMPFSATGVLASLAVPLANAGIGIFVLSTFDTDYLFVKKGDFDNATAALQAAGHQVDCTGST